MCREPWSCGVTKKIKEDDRVFLIKLGQNPRGIIASGWITRGTYIDRHWDEKRREEGKTAFWVDVVFDTILNPDVKILPIEKLQSKYIKMKWDPAASGITIPDEIALELEKDWATFLKQRTPEKELVLPEETDINLFLEGAKKQITINSYERSAMARTICMRHHGVNCSICSLNFEKLYGEIGASYIHVHHLVPLSDIKKDYKLNAIKDLRPVCPNCHAMIHRKKPAFTLEEVKELIEKAHKRMGD